LVPSARHSSATSCRTAPTTSLSSLPLSPRFSRHRDAPPPDLHSFPTRRSSDLQHHRLALRHDEDLFLDAVSARACEQSLKKVLRSEEHTSELQSLAYLVCRLLLEKKKIVSLVPFNRAPSSVTPVSRLRRLGWEM